MARNTSIETFNTIKETGLLTKMRLEIYHEVFKNGPCTSGEAFYSLHKSKPIKSLTQSRARFTELRDMGFFQEVGMRSCRVTGRNAIIWDVTNGLPVAKKKYQQRQSRQELITDLLDFPLEQADINVKRNGPEDAAVLALCKQWGYGAVMAATQRLWMRQDYKSAFSIGHCLGVLSVIKKNDANK